MEKNPLNKGVLTENSVGIGTVTGEMIRARARELALIAGRTSSEASPTDFAQAERELTGGPEIDPQEALLNSRSAKEGWATVSGSAGTQVADSSSEDEDDDGLSESAQLVEEGIGEAEHDQRLQAAREAEQQDRREP